MNSDEPNEIVVFETAELTELQLARNLIEQEGKSAAEIAIESTGRRVSSVRRFQR